MTRAAPFLAAALFLSAVSAEAQVAQATHVPSIEFATKALNVLTSAPTMAAARWQDVSRARPRAILAAIASAEKKGWHPTSETVHAVSKGKAGVRPVAFVQDYYGNWRGRDADLELG